MIAANFEHNLKSHIADIINVEEVTSELYTVGIPIYHSDGDACELYVSRSGDGYKVSDGGVMTSLAEMHGINMRVRDRKERLDKIADFFGVQLESGEIVQESSGDDLPRAVFNVTQACIEMGLAAKRPVIRKRKRNEEFTQRFTKIIDRVDIDFDEDWHPNFDTHGDAYRVDYHFENKGSDFLVFGASDTANCWRAASTILHYQKTLVNSVGVIAYQSGRIKRPEPIFAIQDLTPYSIDLSESNETEFQFLLEGLAA